MILIYFKLQNAIIFSVSGGKKCITKWTLCRFLLEANSNLQIWECYNDDMDQISRTNENWANVKILTYFIIWWFEHFVFTS